MAARSLERMRAALRRAQLAYGFTEPQTPPDEAPLRFVALCRGALLGELARRLAPAELVCALSPKAALDMALSDLADGVIIDSAVRDLRIVDFIETLRAHPGLSDLPLIALAPAYEAPALLEAGIDRVPSIDELAASAGALGMARRSLRQLRDQLRLAKGRGSRAVGTGEDGIKRHITIALAAEKPRFVLATLTPRDSDHVSTLSAEAAISQALCQLLATLTRAEDIVMQFNFSRYAIIFPDISADEAEAVIARLDSVVRSSAFMRQNGDIIQGLSLLHQLVSNEGFTDATVMWEHVAKAQSAGPASPKEA